MFALADLRSLECDRVAEEERAAEARRLDEERRRAAEEQRRCDEAARQAEAAVRRQREREEREALAAALQQKSGRNDELEADVRQLRALLDAALPSHAPRRNVSAVALVVAGVAAAALIGAIVVATLQRPAIRERVVYVAAPTPPAPSLPQPATALPPPPVASPPTSAMHSANARASRHSQKRATPPAKRESKLPTVDDCDGKDPLCGTTL